MASQPFIADLHTRAFIRARDAAQRLDTVCTEAIREGKQSMSVLGKIDALTSAATDFNQTTPAVLDGIAAKIAVATQKRDELAAKHHAYYDGIIKGVDDSIAVVDRLSNVPLGDGSAS